MTFKERFAEKAELTKKDATKLLAAFNEAVKEGLDEDGKVQIYGIGSLTVVTRAAREGHNPATGAKLHIPEKKGIKFKAAKALKKSL